MRLLEIASAEEQIALFKLVSDSVWQALTTQQKQQAEAEAAKQQAAKLKPKTALRNRIAVPSKKLPIPKQQVPTKNNPNQLNQQQRVAGNFVANEPISAQNSVDVSANKINWQNGKQA